MRHFKEICDNCLHAPMSARPFCTNIDAYNNVISFALCSGLQNRVLIYLLSRLNRITPAAIKGKIENSFNRIPCYKEIESLANQLQ